MGEFVHCLQILTLFFTMHYMGDVVKVAKTKQPLHNQRFSILLHIYYYLQLLHMAVLLAFPHGPEPCAIPNFATPRG